MHIRDQENSNNFHGYKDLIMNSKFIKSQQTHRKKELHQIDLQETIVLRIKRERKPSSYCLRTRRSMVDYSCIIGEAPMRMMNPSVMVLDWISWFWNLRRLELCFVDSPRVSGIFGNL